MKNVLGLDIGYGYTKYAILVNNELKLGKYVTGLVEVPKEESQVSTEIGRAHV